MFFPVAGNAVRSVWSVLTEPAHLQCPRHWSSAMKSPFCADWLEGLYKHLDSCNGYGTFDFPIVPPGNATVLDLVVSIKHKLDEMNPPLERKVRLCANGLQQVAGLSYAPATLPSSLRMLCAVAGWLCVTLGHVDVSNAFHQSTPDKHPTTYMRCFPENFLWLELWYPHVYAALKRQHEGKRPSEFAMLMRKYVQGRVDASLKWKEAVDEVLLGILKLTLNPADSCIYSGVVSGDPVVLGRATDHFLLATTSRAHAFIVNRY